MGDERIDSTVRGIGGKVEEGIGKIARDTKTGLEGVADQAVGAVQDAYGKTVDVAVEGAQTVKGAAIAGHDYLRKFMEDNPHTTTAIALGIGLLIGYMAHQQPSRRDWWG